jgi:hypothetical protein
VQALVAAADSADEDKAFGVKLLVDIGQVLAEKNVNHALSRAD